MRLIVENNILVYNGKRIPCVIGKNGATNNKVEGDGCTPSGIYNFTKIYFRADKIKKISFQIESSVINPDDGWCDDTNSSYYNQFIKFPFNFSAEKLFRDDDLYDIVCVINYNTEPVQAGKGSAIFLHVASKDFTGTEGCIAIKKDHLVELISKIDNTTTIEIKS